MIELIKAVVAVALFAAIMAGLMVILMPLVLLGY
tara:strand:+ start:8523 stop:8624 length:102 start_codon:yes stop_codon:yes gene_type:complete